MVSLLIFLGIVVLSLLAIFFGFYTRKYSINENRKYLIKRSWGLLLLALGFIIHTLGDVLSVRYGVQAELGLESIAHVIILFSFLFIIISSRDILNSIKGYWFK